MLVLGPGLSGFIRALNALKAAPTGVSPDENARILEDFANARRRAWLIREGRLNPLSAYLDGVQ